MSPNKTANYIQIFWNGKQVKVRPGAKVESLLSEEEWESCQNGKAIILDSHGHETGISGSLTAGVQLHIEFIDNKKNAS